jgi:hypothetical protein
VLKREHLAFQWELAAGDKFRTDVNLKKKIYIYIYIYIYILRFSTQLLMVVHADDHILSGNNFHMHEKLIKSIMDKLSG